jgi:DNA polymerase II large subunit
MTDCTHAERREGRCVACGDCLHEIILNGACFICGTTELDPIALSPKKDGLIGPDKLVRKK